jgi:hypothetical protein
MIRLPGRRRIAVVSACANAAGSPGFALSEVEVTPEEAADGRHFRVAEARLREGGYEPPFVHFDEDEAPAFLHAAVRQYLGCHPATPARIPLLRRTD